MVYGRKVGKAKSDKVADSDSGVDKLVEPACMKGKGLKLVMLISEIR